MTYNELLKKGSINEIVEALLDVLATELRYRHKGFPQEIVRGALIEFFERGRQLERQLVLQTLQQTKTTLNGERKETIQ